MATGQPKHFVCLFEIIVQPFSKFLPGLSSDSSTFAVAALRASEYCEQSSTDDLFASHALGL